MLFDFSTKLRPTTKLEVKTVYEDNTKYVISGDYSSVQILNLLDTNYSNKNGIKIFQEEAFKMFKEMCCCTNKIEVGFVNFAGKDQLSVLPITNDVNLILNYINNVPIIEKNNPGSSINDALNLVSGFNWKSNTYKILNILSNNKPYIETSVYQCYKNDPNFPEETKTEVDEVLNKIINIKNSNIFINCFYIENDKYIYDYTDSNKRIP